MPNRCCRHASWSQMGDPYAQSTMRFSLGHFDLNDLGSCNHKHFERGSSGFQNAEEALKNHVIIILLLALVLSALAYPAEVHASPVTVLLTPSSQAVPQGTITTVAVALTGAPPGTPAGTSGYDLSLTGFPHGAEYSFSPARVPTGSGSGGSTLRIDTNSAPLYCPGTYPYTVTASNTTIPDSGSVSGTITVVQAGSPISVTVTTDKQTYRIGENVTIRITASRPAEGSLTISGPARSPSVSYYTIYGPSYSVTKTLSVSTVGRYTIRFDADDFCSGFNSSVATFDVTPDTYDVSISIDGVPSTVSAPLTVDSQDKGSIGGSEIEKFTFKLDTSHTIMVAQYLKGDAGVRYYAAQNTWTAKSAGSHVFSYETEYLLTLTSNPEGIASINYTGWYGEGSNVQTGLAPQTVSDPTGTQYAFVGWEVDGVPQNGNPISLTMNRPHQVIARYQIHPLTSVTSSFATSVATSTTQSHTSSESTTTTSSFVTPPLPASFSSWPLVLIAAGTVFCIILVSAVAVVRLRPRAPRYSRLGSRPFGAILAVTCAGILLAVSFWQLEIAEIAASQNTLWCPPFKLMSCLSSRLAHDISYAGIFFAFAIAFLGVWEYSDWNRKRQATYSAAPSTVGRKEYADMTDLDRKLYAYITEHGGTISLSAASGELEATIDEIKASIERLKRAGKISPQ
jgi:hypothetical protein